MCSIGYNVDNKPTLRWREGDQIYWHGSAASRFLEAVDKSDVCVTVSIIDGLVLARSAFNWNVNHRSVMIFGQATRITDPDENVRRPW
jgi:nitroimidazol reductase NimA-like FMN-containing flavoprotein (pyridoxamine 5'-phosphate oxidase superfamily)